MFSMSTKAILHFIFSTILHPLDLFWTLPGISISIYGAVIRRNGIWFGQKLHDIVRLMVFVAIMASVLSIRYLLVIAQKDLNQGGQEIGAYKTTQEGVLGELL
ncbi:hypothetical protein SO802_000178 [Lithocarpus litseifolius]|uniref:Uncharacterized protein n=1 Tax=Lithocarpus litseifolius TaxID=425828 RepID=A0AAW2DSM9_9ROSI